MSEALGADIQARLIHHVEHDHQALVFFPEQKAAALSFGAQRHAAGRTAVDSHFFFHTAANDVVWLSQAAVVVDPDLGHKEQ